MIEVNGDVEEIKKGALYPLLAMCTNNDLDPLVQIIISRNSNNLVSHIDYKLNNPNHKMYYKVIGDEICSFGGHSLANKFRGSKGPDYSEIVADVCDTLMVPFVRKDIVQNEKNLIDLFFEDGWDNISDVEQEENANKARLMVEKKLSLPQQKVKSAIINLAPLALVSTGLNQNYQVTAPCVIHIAYLRRKMMDKLRKSSVILLQSPKKQESLVDSERLVIATEGGDVVFQISRIEEPISKTEWSNTDNNISALNPLLQAVPGLVAAFNVAKTQYMRVESNGPLAPIKGVEGAMRGLVLGKKGIESHASLYNAGRLASIINISAIVGVASIVLAQKHLSDISHKLTEINESIQNISNFQKNARRSVMLGAIKYFKQIAPSILAGELSDSSLHILNSQELDLLKIQTHLDHDIREELKIIESLKDNQFFSSSEINSKIEEEISKTKDLYFDLYLCICARAYGLQLLCAFPGNEKLKEQRFLSIEESLESIKPDSCIIKMYKILRKKIHEIEPTLVFGAMVNKNKLKFFENIDASLEEIKVWQADAEKNVRDCYKNLQSLNVPVSFIARIENGEIKAVAAE